MRAFLPILLTALLLSGCRVNLPTNGSEQSNGIGFGISTPGSIPYEEITCSAEEIQNRYYYTLLDEECRKIYSEILSGLRQHRETITTHGNDPELVNRVFTSVYMDWPECFWIDGTVKTTCYSGFVNYSEVCPNYLYDAETSAQRMEEIQQAADAMLEELDRNQSVYEQIHYVYDLLIRRVDYEPGAADNQNICSVFLNGKSVCAGYARSFQYLMNRLGIFSVYVTGTTANGESHAWNLVRCGEYFYNVDVTWGDPVFAAGESGEQMVQGDYLYHDFLCCSDEEIWSSHRVSEDFPLPPCLSTDLEYYRLRGRYFTQVDSDHFLTLLKEDIDRGDSWTELKFGSEESYQAAVKDLDGLLKESARYLGERYGLSRVAYSYSSDELTKKIIIFWNYQPA